MFVAIRIRAITIQIEVGRTWDTAEARLFLRVPVDDDHGHVEGKCAAFVSHENDNSAICRHRTHETAAKWYVKLLP
jgi:hypothetical protein